MFEWARGVEIREVTDGTSNTRLDRRDESGHTLDAARRSAVRPRWTVAAVRKWSFRRISCDLCRWLTRFIRSSIESHTLKSLLTRDGGEVVDWRLLIGTDPPGVSRPCPSRCLRLLKPIPLGSLIHLLRTQCSNTSISDVSFRKHGGSSAARRTLVYVRFVPRLALWSLRVAILRRTGNIVQRLNYGLRRLTMSKPNNRAGRGSTRPRHRAA